MFYDPTESAGPRDAFFALADPTRRQLMAMLASGEMDVTSLSAPFSMSMPAISQHLKILREAGLVSQSRRGQQRIYKLEKLALAPFSDWLNNLRAESVESSTPEA